MALSLSSRRMRRQSDDAVDERGDGDIDDSVSSKSKRSLFRSLSLRLSGIGGGSGNNGDDADLPPPPTVAGPDESRGTPRRKTGGNNNGKENTSDGTARQRRDSSSSSRRNRSGRRRRSSASDGDKDEVTPLKSSFMSGARSHKSHGSKSSNLSWADGNASVTSFVSQKTAASLDTVKMGNLKNKPSSRGGRGSSSSASSRLNNSAPPVSVVRKAKKEMKKEAAAAAAMPSSSMPPRLVTARDGGAESFLESEKKKEAKSERRRRRGERETTRSSPSSGGAGQPEQSRSKGGGGGGGGIGDDVGGGEDDGEDQGANNQNDSSGSKGTTSKKKKSRASMALLRAVRRIVLVKRVLKSFRSSPSGEAKRERLADDDNGNDDEGVDVGGGGGSAKHHHRRSRHRGGDKKGGRGDRGGGPGVDRSDSWTDVVGVPPPPLDIFHSTPSPGGMGGEGKLFGKQSKRRGGGGTRQKARTSSGGADVELPRGGVRTPAQPRSPSSSKAATTKNLPVDEAPDDGAIRGRLDGLDGLSLGPARRPLDSDDRWPFGGGGSAGEGKDVIVLPDDFFGASAAGAGAAHRPTPADLVRAMLWESCGRDPPEIVLEGHLAGGVGRWVVRVEGGGGDGGGRRRSSVRRRRSREEETAPKGDEMKDKTGPKVEKEDEKVECARPDPPEDRRSVEEAASTDTGAPGAPAGGCGNDDDDDDAAKQEEGECPEEDRTEQSAGEDTVQAVAAGDGDEYDHHYDRGEDDDEDEPPTEDHGLLLEQMWGRDNPPPPGTFSHPAESPCPVDVDEDIFVIDDASHLRAVHDSAAAHLGNARFDDALDIFDKIVRSLRQREKAPRHLVGSAWHNMGIVQLWAGRNNAALKSLQEAVRVRRDCLGVDHPDVAVSLAKLGTSYFALEHFSNAIATFEKAMKIRRKVMDRDHLELAKLYSNIGCCYYYQNKVESALKAFTSGLSILRLWLSGPIQRENIVYDASVALGNMGKLYLERGDGDMSLYVYEEALLLKTAVFKKDHKLVLASLANLAYAKARSGDYAKAIQIYKGILRTQVLQFGIDCREAVETEALMGVLFIRLSRYEEALKCLERVHLWQKRSKVSDATIQITENTMKKIEQSMGGENSPWI